MNFRGDATSLLGLSAKGSGISTAILCSSVSPPWYWVVLRFLEKLGTSQKESFLKQARQSILQTGLPPSWNPFLLVSFRFSLVLPAAPERFPKTQLLSAPEDTTLSQGLLFWLFAGGFKASSGTVNGMRAFLVLTDRIL